MVYTGEYKAKSSLSNGRLPSPGAPGELALDEQKSTCCLCRTHPTVLLLAVVNSRFFAGDQLFQGELSKETLVLRAKPCFFRDR